MERLFGRTTSHSLAIYDKFKPEYSSVEHIDAINRCDLVFISVPTPINQDGQGCDVSAVEDCVAWVQPPMCIRSTIIVGTTDRLSAQTGKALCFSPEYLGESSFHLWPEDGVCGFMIVGGPDQLIDLVIEAYKPAVASPTQFYRTTALTAELCKYMENCFLATKVAFVNQFYDIATTFNVDYAELKELWLADPRIGQSHTTVTEERGFRGRCLPKDLLAMIAAMKPHGGALLLEAIQTYNAGVCAIADEGSSILSEH